MLQQEFNGRNRDVFLFVGHDIDLSSELAKSIFVGKLLGDTEVTHLACWRITRITKRDNPITALPCGDGKHPAELASAKHA